jgi:hypothetical protein
MTTGSPQFELEQQNLTANPGARPFPVGRERPAFSLVSPNRDVLSPLFWSLSYAAVVLVQVGHERLRLPSYWIKSQLLYQFSCGENKNSGIVFHWGGDNYFNRMSSRLKGRTPD